MGFPQSTGGGTSSPLTTKGDIWGFDTGNNRIPVGTDGFPLQADSGQALGVGYATRGFNFNSQLVSSIGARTVGGMGVFSVAAAGTVLRVGDTASGLTVQQNVITDTSNLTWTAAGIPWIGVRISPTLAFNNFNPSTVVGMQFQPNISGSLGTEVVTNLQSILAKPTITQLNATNVYGLFANPLISTGGVVTNLWGVEAKLDASFGTITTGVGFDAVSTNTGGTITTVIGFRATSLVGNTIWGFQIGNYNSYHVGPMTIGAAAAPIPSAILDLSQTTTGALVVPKMTTTQKNALTAADGMIVFDTTLAQFQVRQGGAWIRMSAA